MSRQKLWWRPRHQYFCAFTSFQRMKHLCRHLAIPSSLQLAPRLVALPPRLWLFQSLQAGKGRLLHRHPRQHLPRHLRRNLRRRLRQHLLQHPQRRRPRRRLRRCPRRWHLHRSLGRGRDSRTGEPRTAKPRLSLRQRLRQHPRLVLLTSQWILLTCCFQVRWPLVSHSLACEELKEDREFVLAVVKVRSSDWKSPESGQF
mmetsp:Transcript_32205/g.60130  ORF Transcript_32205/g.60130 Transcript_32205/m.60130 type:complete len:201 (+) Transcript_32205:2195-2797(+)